MFKLLFISILTILPLFSDEYDFDMDEFEPKAYEYNGYLRLDNKFQQLNENTKNHQNYMHLEALFDFSYFYDIYFSDLLCLQN